MAKFLIISFLLSFSILAMDKPPARTLPPNELCVIFWDRILMLRENGQLLIDNNIFEFSPAEIILLRISDHKPSFVAMHIDDAFEVYVNNNNSEGKIVYELSLNQQEIIKFEKKYYNLLCHKILNRQLRTENYLARPSAAELNSLIPSLSHLNKMLQNFLNKNGSVTKYEKFALKKWLNFNHTDSFFPKLYGNAIFSLQQVNIPKSWIIRDSSSFKDDLEEQVFCRTIAYLVNGENNLRGGIRILHLLGVGYFVAQDLNETDNWIDFPDFVSLLKYYGKKTIELSSYIGPCALNY